MAGETADVVVVGAGLAGLRAATVLAVAGLHVIVLDAEDVVGGRQRTDIVDGFRLDRGFQVLNPAYPAVQRWVDVDSLDLQPFPVGVLVRRADRMAELAHPLRHPSRAIASLRSGLLSPRELIALARWAGPALRRPRAVIAGPDRTLREGWDAAGLRGPLRTEVLEPFLAGVLADDSLVGSDAFAQLLVRMFALGRPGLPAEGIAALPRHLAAVAVAAGAELRLGMRVEHVRTASVAVSIVVAGGDTITAGAAVVAVGPDAVDGLADIARPPTLGLQTWWFAADEPPSRSAMLAVDGRRAGPVVNTAVMSNTNRAIAPAGSNLIQATALLPAGARTDARLAPDERTIRAHVAEIWGASTADWRLLRRDDVHDALPAQRPPLRVAQPPMVADGGFVAGDHRDTASIQGALVSGDRVARAVITRLHGRR